METILGLLLILLPAVFKLLEKKLKDSGNVADVISEEIIEPVPPKQKKAAPPVKPKTVTRPSRPVMVEEEKTEKKEKIDPKKLVIYSEIMKPKF